MQSDQIAVFKRLLQMPFLGNFQILCVAASECLHKFFSDNKRILTHRKDLLSTLQYFKEIDLVNPIDIENAALNSIA